VQEGLRKTVWRGPELLLLFDYIACNILLFESLGGSSHCCIWGRVIIAADHCDLRAVTIFASAIVGLEIFVIVISITVFPTPKSMQSSS